MAMSLDKKPIYDERVNEILRGLTEGKTRDELAEEFGYANYKSLDMHMRRRNFTWDRDKQTYMPIYNRLEERDLEVSLTASSKAATVLSLFQKEGADARTIAKRLGFTDHRELAVYMKGKGYEWSSEAGNYVKMRGQVQEDLGNDNSSLQDFGEEDREAGQGQPLGATTPVPVRFTQLEGGKLEKYLPLLEMLERNKDKLIDLLVPTAEGSISLYVTTAKRRTSVSETSLPLRCLTSSVAMGTSERWKHWWDKIEAWLYSIGETSSRAIRASNTH
ncbi:hypothetical protein [Brevibacillus centrosporus]|uniref:Uncharacterized protein n=1 Tax=Brevibacillus centrosporus TaxID=54910 RepID=A0A1I4CCA9_9BACL|nr:hypothetical protein [Brevibacillus centrosporus]SFK78838.1 hypothetical protein SAMN05518846_1209 [Brevibacillus centrosporus]